MDISSNEKKLPYASLREQRCPWPADLLFREDVDGEPFQIQRNITTPFLPPDTTLQTNVVTKRETTELIIVWHFLDKESVEAKEAGKLGRGPATLDGKFVRSMQVGDCITLWDRARFRGWEPVIQKVKITVYWAV
ncbi:hypothetical protein M405DRAFT_19945 [Rhizopogon salebrosus TDB-379]|jgi:hypothetical protein|nr:hypothetical protein M405DRAFT_19945 [Rhizopogon salebrosus TDB-379]